MALLDQSYSSGGSSNSAYGYNSSQSSAMAGTDAMSARLWSQQMANTAYTQNLQAMREQNEFNATEAQKQRDWEERMANTIYTRSVKNMREAGINPILAANMGLSGAAVGSGATATSAGFAGSPLAQNFMDSYSAQNASSGGENWASGSSWQSSEAGFVTGLQALSGLMDGVEANINSSNMLEMLKGSFYDIMKILDNDKGTQSDVLKNLGDYILDTYGNVRRDTYRGYERAREYIQDAYSRGLDIVGNGLSMIAPTGRERLGT